MSLPKVVTPEFTVTLPSTGEEISYRPFLIGEEKILYMAMEGEDPFEVAKAITNVVQTCITTPNVDVDGLASFDMEYLFIKLRAKSVKETSRVGLKHEKKKCGHVTPVEINLDEIEVSVPKKQTFKKSLTDTIGVKLKYPTLKDTKRVISETNSPIEQTFSAIAYCITAVWDENEVYEEFTHGEMVEWLQSLNKDQFTKLLNWFQNIPTLEKEVTYKCEGCEEDVTVKLRGMMSFFE